MGLKRPVAWSVAAATLGAGLAVAWPVFPALCASALLTGGATGCASIALQRHVGRAAATPTQLKQVFSWLAIGPAVSNFLGPFAAGLVIDAAGFRWAFLLMALLRAVGIPCRFHGFTIDKPLQKGAITGLAYWLAPQRIIHSWVEVSLEGRWIALEGFILDAPYLASLQRRFPQARRFCGYGAATPDLSAPGVEWRGQDTYIQKEGIADDFGVFDSPDAFYARHGSNLSGLKRWLYERVIRHAMNRNVARIRASKW